jgi:hypothetical protein
MTELNPYESPQMPPNEPRKGTTTKRTIGLLTLSILTPLAVFFTGCISCLAVGPTVDAVGRSGINNPQSPYTLLIVVGFAVFLIPPIIVLIFMGHWIIVAYHREALERTKKLNDPTS